MSIPTETIEFDNRTWNFTGQYFADWAIYENSHDLILVNPETGKVEKKAYYSEGTMKNVLEDVK